MFLGYINCETLGTAVIGASKGCSVIKKFMESYDDINEAEPVNNGLLTDFFKLNFKNFKADGKRVTLQTDKSETIEIFTEDKFEVGKIIGYSNTLHFCDGSWRGRKISKFKDIFKIIACRLPINLVALKRVLLDRKHTNHDGHSDKI